MLIVRTVFALLVAAPLFLVTSVLPGTGDQTYTAVATMSAPAPGMTQLFYDDGSGFSEPHSARLPALEGLQPYRFPLPVGTYTNFRLDPGFRGGRYVIDAFVILGPDGTPFATVPLDRFGALYQMTVVERSATRLVLDSPGTASDPFVVIQLPEPLRLPQFSRTPGQLAVAMLEWWLLMLTVIVLVERVTGALGTRLTDVWRRHWSVLRTRPIEMVAVMAVLATTAAMYPVIFDHRSLVSPSDGPVPMLYDHPPLVPGSTDFDVEDTRGSDVGATMWGFVPYSRVQREAIASGDWPLWNRMNGSGRPLWGQGQSFLLDPLHWLTFVKENPAPGWDLKFVAHRLVFASGMGVAALLATGSLPAALTATAVAPFAGYYTYRFNHPATFAITYGPWILVAWFLLARAMDWTARARAALLLTLASSLVLVASPPKEGSMVLLGCEFTGVLALLLARGSMRQRAAGFTAAGVAGITTVLLTLPHWLVFLDALARALTVYDAPVVHFATMESVQGFVFGSLSPISLQPSINAIAVAFAIAAVLTPPLWVARRDVAACALGAIGLFATAFGVLPREWILAVPLIRNIGHFGGTVISAAIVPTLVLTGAGVHAVTSWRRGATALLCVSLATGAFLLLWTTGGLAGFRRFDHWALLVVLLVASLAPLVVAAAHRHPGRALPAVCTVAAFSAVVLPGGLHFRTGMAPVDHLLSQPRPRVALNANSPATDAARLAHPDPTRVVGFDSMLFQGTQALYELESIGGADALELGRYRELLDAGGIQRDWGWLTLVPLARVEQINPLLDLLNVGLLVGRQNQFGAKAGPTDPDGDGWIDISIRPNTWPRAFFVDGVQPYDTPISLLIQAQAEGHPIAGVEVTDVEALDLTAHLSKRSTIVVPARDYVLTTNTTRFRMDTPGSGVVVLTESYLPDDFRLTMNGKPATYFRVNHAFKGVVIPGPGSWDIRFEYRPNRWDTAWRGAALGALLCLALAAAATGRTPRGHRRQPTLG